MLALDCLENLLAASAEKFNIDGQFRLDFRDERQALREPFGGTFHLKLHEFAEGGCIVFCADYIFINAEAAQVFERKIDSSLGKIRAYVLPEIRKLKRSACVI